MTRLREIQSENQKVIFPKKEGVKITNCRISRDKLITKLDDEREIGILVSSLAKWRILDKNVKPEQLKNNEIRSEGRVVYFPDIDEVLPAWKIIEGLHACS